LEQVINPYALYALLALGGVGLWIALPKKGFNPQILGGLLAAIALGGLMVALGVRAGEQRPGFFFYVFSLIALGAGLRMISHPVPVYAALYFILTILSSAGLYLLLSAEFMAFALIIVYAGAILITYLFVIMLATQPPSPGQDEALTRYDRTAREPGMAVLVGFLLLGVLTTMLSGGVSHLGEPIAVAGGDAALASLPGKVERELRRAGLADPGDRVAVSDSGRQMIDPAARTAVLEDAGGGQRTVALPEDVHQSNIEGVGFELLGAHPGAIEMAGIILLMAMLGAVVLARKHAELDEAAKLDEARRLDVQGVGP